MGIQSVAFDLSTYPKFKPESDTEITYCKGLARISHGYITRLNGRNYYEDHFPGVRRQIIDIVPEGFRSQFTSPIYLHDTAEDTITSTTSSLFTEHKMTLATLYEHLEPMGEERAREIINIVGLLTKIDIENRPDPGRYDYNDFVGKYEKKFFRILGKREPLVLGQEVPLEHRIQAALIGIGDLGHNGNPEEELGIKYATKTFYEYPKKACDMFLGSSFSKKNDSSNLEFREFLSLAQERFAYNSTRNARRIITQGFKLMKFILEQEPVPFIDRERLYQVAENRYFPDAIKTLNKRDSFNLKDNKTIGENLQILRNLV